MSPRRVADDSTSLTKEDVAAWLQQEIDHSRKAMELRVKDATGIATAFQENRLSAKEAADEIYRHENRWGEALPGVWTTEGKTDQQILAELDEARIRQRRRTEHGGGIQTKTRERNR
jgi:hypothetical protein